MTTKDEALALALEALKLAEESLGSFVSDHGWSQSDMDNLDTVTAAITAIKQAQQAYVDSTPELSVGESSFESWYSTYERQGVSKQVARDAYAAGMGDPLVQPKAQEAVVEPHFVGCAYYESNGACCESGEPCKADVQNNAALPAPKQAHQALIGCVEHLEFSTPQGRAAYEAAKAAINQESIADSELSGMWSNSDFTGGATDCAYPAPKQAEPAWQPIESAPKDGTKILVCTHSGKVDITWWIGNGFHAGGDQYGPHTWTTCGDSALAFWQPLPTPPEAA